MRRLIALSKPDLIGAGLVLACGAFLVIKAPSYGLHTGDVIGPGFMPFWFGAAMLVLGISIIVGTVLRARGAIAGEAPESAEAEPSVSAHVGEDVSAAVDDGASGAAAEQDSVPGTTSRHRPRKVVMVFASTLVAAALVPVLGALVAFGLLIFVLLLAVERKRWWVSAVVSVGVVYVLYLLFFGFLRIPLPTGPWGF